MKRLIPILLPLIVLMFTGCASDRLVIIRYTPLINTKIIDGKPPAYPIEKAGAGKILSLYCITSVQNTGKDALDFNFDLARLRIDGGEVLVQHQHPSDWPWTAKSKLVPAKTTAHDLGRVIVDFAIDGPDQHNSWAQLKYETGLQGNSGKMESVLMIQEPPNPAPPFVPVLSIGNTPLCPTSQPAR